MERLEELPGLCPICECPTTFKATGPWLRETLLCDPCPKQMGRSVPRERALALVLKTLRPNWRDLAIHESSPARRGEEVTHEVIESPKSAVWRQAENRMHTARAALAWLLGVR